MFSPAGAPLTMKATWISGACMNSGGTVSRMRGLSAQWSSRHCSRKISPIAAAPLRTATAGERLRSTRERERERAVAAWRVRSRPTGPVPATEALRRPLLADRHLERAEQPLLEQLGRDCGLQHGAVRLGRVCGVDERRHGGEGGHERFGGHGGGGDDRHQHSHYPGLDERTGGRASHMLAVEQQCLRRQAVQCCEQTVDPAVPEAPAGAVRTETGQHTGRPGNCAGWHTHLSTASRARSVSAEPHMP